MAEKPKKIFLYSILIFFALILLAAGTLFTYQKVYAGKIYRNISINNIDLSGLSKAQADNVIRPKLIDILNREVTFSANGKEVKAKLVDTGLTFNLSDIVDQAYGIGRNNNFLNNLLSSSKTIALKKNIIVTPYIDEAKLTEFKNVAINQLNSDPNNANISIVNGEVKVADSADGQTIDTSNLDKEIVLVSKDNQSKIEIPYTKVSAKLQNSDYQDAMTTAQSYLSKKITFTYNDKSFSPSASQIGNWISFSDNNGKISASLNDSNIKAYLNNISASFTVNKVDQKVDSTTGDIIQQGQQGIYIDANKTLAALKTAINSSNSFSVAIVTSTVNPEILKITQNDNVQTGRFTGKYIDVDITNQKLCRIDGTNLIDCFTVSSGKPSTPTIPGTFSILEKAPNKWSSEDGLWMPWWEEYEASGYGIHELPIWPNGVQEGVGHLGTPVSHGCVRLGDGPAELVYNWTEIGTPVYIHT